MKRTLSALVVGLGLVIAAPAGALQEPAIRPGVTVAYVSGQRLSLESLDGKAAQLRLQTVRQQKTTELQEKQRALEAWRHALELEPNNEELRGVIREVTSGSN